jgi:hypothetical protein
MLLAASPAMSQHSTRKTELTMSPNKAYEVKYVSVSPEFCLRKTSQHKWHPIVVPNPYAHNLEVLWAPDSAKFAITDAGPALVDVYVYFVRDRKHPIVVSKKLEAELKKEVGEINASIDSRQYLVIQPKRWINSSLLELDVDLAYVKSEPNLKGIELKENQKWISPVGAHYHWLYLWDLGKSFNKAKKLTANE